jgi:hypothetical protein
MAKLVTIGVYTLNLDQIEYVHWENQPSSQVSPDPSWPPWSGEDEQSGQSQSYTQDGLFSAHVFFASNTQGTGILFTDDEARQLRQEIERHQT